MAKANKQRKSKNSDKVKPKIPSFSFEGMR